MNNSILRKTLICSVLCMLVAAAPTAFGVDDDLISPLPDYPTSDPDLWTTTPALVGLPVGAVLTDHVDVGDTTSEASHGMSTNVCDGTTMCHHGDCSAYEWGGICAWLSPHTIRAMYPQDGVADPPPYPDPKASATMTLDFGSASVNKYMAVLWNRGDGNDSFDIDIAGDPNSPYSVSWLDGGPLSNNVAITGVFDVGVQTSVQTVTFTATADPWPSQHIYAQAQISEVAAWRDFTTDIYVDNGVSCVTGSGQADPYSVIYCNIQDAIDDAQAGDTINVAAGTYNVATRIAIDKPLELIGENPATTIIDGPGTSVSIPCQGLIAMDGVAGSVTIKNLTLQDAPEQSTTWATDLVVAKNIPPAASVTIENNILIGRDDSNAFDEGIWIAEGSASSQVTIKDNDLSRMHRGIILERMLGPSTVQGNDIHHLVAGFYDPDTWAAQGLYYLTYDGDVTTQQLADANTFSDYAGCDIIFQGGHAWISDGKFTDVKIQNNTVNAVGSGPEHMHVGIMLLNDAASDFNAGGVHNAEITGNTVGTGGPDSTGIKIDGHNTNVSLLQNHVTSLGTGILVAAATGAPDVTASENSITGNTLGFNNTTALVLDASGNWWGDGSGPGGAGSGSGDAVSADLDYTPWCALDGTYTTPGFQGDFSELWVDDDSPQTGLTARIQEGIDLVTGSTVNVAAGLYTEQVTILKSLDLIGAGAGSNPATDSIIQAPTSGRTTITEGTYDWDYVVAADGNSAPIDVKIQGFAIDANGEDGSGTLCFTGVFFRDVGDGSNDGLYSCTIDNFGSYYGGWQGGSYNTFTGNSGVVGYGTCQLTVDDCNIADYTVQGIAARGSASQYTVSSNDLDGTDSNYAGLYVNSASATIAGNAIHDHPGIVGDGEHVGIGIYLYEATASGVTIDTGNAISDNLIGLFLKGTNGATIDGNTFTDSTHKSIVIQQDSDDNVVSDNTITVASYNAGLQSAITISGDSGGNVIGGDTAADGNDITMPTTGGDAWGAPYSIHASSADTGDLTIKYNTITGGKRAIQFDGWPGHSGTNTVSYNTITGSPWAGIDSFCHGDFVITGNTITGTDRPMEFWQGGNGDITITANTITSTAYDGIRAGSYATMTASANAFVGMNGINGITNDVTTHTLDATSSWWGDASGPMHATTNPAGTGSPVSDYVKYSPWVASSGADADPGTPGWQPDLSAVGVSTNGTIAEGIDLVTGSTVNVAAGTYNEQVRFTKSVTVTSSTGECVSGGVLIDPNGASFEGPRAGADLVRAAVTFEIGSTGAILKGVTINNSNASDLNANAGIEVIDGDIDNVTVENVCVNGVSGHGFGSYHPDHTWPPPSGWTIDGCTFSTSATGTWSGMRPENMDAMTIEDCDIGPTNYGGILLIQANDSAVQLCDVHDTQRAGIQVDAYCTGAIDVLSNEVWNANLSDSPGYSDVRLYSTQENPHGNTPATITIQANTLRDGYNGIYVKPGDLSTRTAVVVQENEIFNHSNYGAQNDATGILDAEDNVWGHASGPDDPNGTTEVPPCTGDPATEVNTNGDGDAVSDNVDYCPWWECLEDGGCCQAHEWCIFDLDHEDGVIGTGDFGIFSGCFGLIYPPGHPKYGDCQASNFDEGTGDCAPGSSDPDCYVVGTGDFGVFSGCFALACGDCENCWASRDGRDDPDESDGAAGVQLVAVPQPTPADVVEVLPKSKASFSVGQTFYLELWASGSRTLGGVEDGLAAVYVDLSYETPYLEVEQIIPGSLFSLLSYGVIGENAGLVRSLGGCAPLGDGTLGTGSTWVRVATLEMSVRRRGLAVVQTDPAGGAFGIAIVNRFGDLDASQVKYGGKVLELGASTVPADIKKVSNR